MLLFVKLPIVLLEMVYVLLVPTVILIPENAPSHVILEKEFPEIVSITPYASYTPLNAKLAVERPSTLMSLIVLFLVQTIPLFPYTPVKRAEVPVLVKVNCCIIFELTVTFVLLTEKIALTSLF